MGYYDYQHGLICRHINQKGGWDKHLEHCRDIILRAIDIFHPVKITVLGSGWLLELPLAEMIEKAKEIVLIDILHPFEVISQTADYKSVKLIEEDISGGLIEEVWKKAGKRTFFNRLTSLDTIVIPQYRFTTDPGMVISLNILTQLESLPIRLLKKRSRVDDEVFLEFRKEIQKNHMSLLENHRSVLISDISEVFTMNDGDSYEEITMVIDLPEGRVTEEWIWDFDPKGLDYNMKRSVLKVTAKIF
jgi:hypothetical protein